MVEGNSFRKPYIRTYYELHTQISITGKAYAQHITTMAERLNIHSITPETTNWSCKIQVVDISRPGEGRERKVKYMNMIFQDEKDNEVKAIVYGEDIPIFQKIFQLFQTYLITGARVQPPTLRNEKPLHAFEWIVDKKTIIDSLDTNDPDEDVLPLPTLLNLTSFQDINKEAFRATKDELKHTEHNVLAIVVHCYPPKYVTSAQKKIQEVVLFNTERQALTLTLWDEAIIEDEGKKLLQQFQQHPIILARRIGVSKFNGTSLITKFKTTIQIDPSYRECSQLQSWIVENQEMLNSFSQRNISQSGTLVSIPADQEIIPIANIHSQPDGHTFIIEAKITLPEKLKHCYVLVCQTKDCGQEVRSATKRKFLCMNCNQPSILSPRCRFDITLEDDSGTTTGIIMGKEGEKLLSLSAEQICALASTQDDSESTESNNIRLNQNWFKIEVKKPIYRTSQVPSAKLFVLSCTEKENTIHSPPAPSTTVTGQTLKLKEKMA